MASATSLNVITIIVANPSSSKILPTTPTERLHQVHAGMSSTASTLSCRNLFTA